MFEAFSSSDFSNGDLKEVSNTVTWQAWGL